MHYNPIPKGFTLIELLVVVAIIAVTLAFGIPNLRATVISNRLTASANDMITALQLARSESIKRGKTAVAGVSIHTNSLGNHESNKWIAWLGSSTLPTSTPTAGTGILIQTYEAASGITVSSTDDTPEYLSNGRLSNTAEIDITFTAAGVTESRVVTIAPSGRVSVATP